MKRITPVLHRFAMSRATACQCHDPRHMRTKHQGRKTRKKTAQKADTTRTEVVVAAPPFGAILVNGGWNQPRIARNGIW